MKGYRFWFQFRGGWLLAAIVTMITTPVAAEKSNFGTISIAPGFNPVQATANGYTGGSFSLSAISNRDREQKVCIGFADPNPDHILVLEKDFDRLKVSIDSGADTTLLIKGPDEETIRCGDDTGRSKDASVEGRNWKKGTYRIWAGIWRAGEKRNYILKIE